MDLFDNTFNAIEKKLDLHLKRHSMLSSNVANADTPNFRAREMDFAGALKSALEQNSTETAKTHESHMDVGAQPSPHIVFDDSGAVGADGNNVDLDLQMGKLSTNANAYSGAVTLMQLKLRMLRLVARGRGGF